MQKNVMLVFSAQDAALKDGLQASLEKGNVTRKDRIIVLSCRDTEGVFGIIRQMRIDFFVVGLALATDPLSRIDEDGGITLCELLRKNGVEAPIALIAPQVGNSLTSRCALLGHVSPYYPGADLDAILSDQIKRYSPPPKTLDLILNAKQGEQWDYRLVGTHFDFQRTGVLQMDPTFLALARTLSRVIGQTTVDWYPSFQELGKAIINQLCRAQDFRAALAEGIGAAGPIERTRITLTVDKAHYEIALEAIFPPEPLPEVPWMVRAPLHRNVSNGGRGENVRPLFGQTMAPLKMLLICADVDGYVGKLWGQDGSVVELKPLRRVQRECEGLRRTLGRHDREFSITQFKQIPELDADHLSGRAIFQALESDNWDIVHFAGHSLSRIEDGKESRGYLFAGAKGSPEAIEISEIASYLARTKLVYLSSCQSSSSAFAVELAQRGVPTVIGFRWSVSDDFAALHAHLFYRYLFQRRQINTAFLNTRRAIYNRYSQRDRVWASSMLVMGAQR
jgi:hypothetical protein